MAAAHTSFAALCSSARNSFPGFVRKHAVWVVATRAGSMQPLFGTTHSSHSIVDSGRRISYWLVGQQDRWHAGVQSRIATNPLPASQATKKKTSQIPQVCRCSAIMHTHAACEAGAAALCGCCANTCRRTAHVHTYTRTHAPTHHTSACVCSNTPSKHIHCGAGVHASMQVHHCTPVPL